MHSKCLTPPDPNTINPLFNQANCITMETEQIKALFEKHHDEYIKFENVKDKLSGRPDIHAFLLLDRLVPSPGSDMVAYSEHDEFYLDVSLDDLSKSLIAEADIVDLVRCGVRIWNGEGLCMFA